MDSAPVTIRHDFRPGDLGRVVELHARLYATEFGLGDGYEAFVAGTVSEYRQSDDRDRLWLAETPDGRLAGCVGILRRADTVAQLRWFLVVPDARGAGLGSRLLQGALGFCRDSGCRSVYLITFDLCADAARLYLAAGFVRTETQEPVGRFGIKWAEERYELSLRP